MSSPWTHAICAPCYQELQPGREPYTIKNAELEKCCRCGDLTGAGIYYRNDPREYLCKGEHA